MNLPYLDKVLPGAIGAAVGGIFALIGKQHDFWATLRHERQQKPLTDAEVAVKRQLADELALRTNREKISLVDDLIGRLTASLLANMDLKQAKALAEIEHLHVLNELRGEIAALREELRIYTSRSDAYAEILRAHGLLPIDREFVKAQITVLQETGATV